MTRDNILPVSSILAAPSAVLMKSMNLKISLEKNGTSTIVVTCFLCFICTYAIPVHEVPRGYTMLHEVTPTRNQVDSVGSDTTRFGSKFFTHWKGTRTDV
jgi:hypothetical protein